jgi:hypothetical protein
MPPPCGGGLVAKYRRGRQAPRALPKGASFQNIPFFALFCQAPAEKKIFFFQPAGAGFQGLCPPKASPARAFKKTCLLVIAANPAKLISCLYSTNLSKYCQALFISRQRIVSL